MTAPAPDDWYIVTVVTQNIATSLNALVRYKDYDGDLDDSGGLRVDLQDRGAVYLFAPGAWTRFSAEPTLDLTPDAEPGDLL